MKTKLTAIAIAFIVTSCATESPQSSDSTATGQAKTAPAPKPKPYPLETCLVSEDDLDEMDERVATVHDGQTFEFCCKPCLVKFKKDPEKYVAKLDAARR